MNALYPIINGIVSMPQISSHRLWMEKSQSWLISVELHFQLIENELSFFAFNFSSKLSALKNVSTFSLFLFVLCRNRQNSRLKTQNSSCECYSSFKQSTKNPHFIIKVLRDRLKASIPRLNRFSFHNFGTHLPI